MISNCGKDENGAYSGGQAGDQTGGEYAVVNWYKRPWNCVLRHPDKSVRSEIARLAKSAANNNKIGYDQFERLTFWTQLTKCGYDPAKITMPCEADCSSSTAAVIKAAGYQLQNAKLMSVSVGLTTYNMRNALRSVGFDVLTENKYLDSPMYLLAGDILLNDQNHAAINLDDGGYADKNYGSSNSSTSPVTVPTGSNNQIINTTTNGVKVGDLVSIASNASYWTGAAVPGFVKSKKWYVVSVNGLRAVLGKSQDGVYNINSPISTNFLTVVKPGESVSSPIGAPEPKPTAPETTVAYKTYTVKKGDSLWSIAAKELKAGRRWTEIMDMNGLRNDRIYVGQVLKLPLK